MDKEKPLEKPQSPDENSSKNPPEDLEPLDPDSSIFDGLDLELEQKKVLSTRLRSVVYMEKRYSGPMPDPETFRAYEEICPGSAKEILNNFLKESDHRRDQEKSQLKIVRNAYKNKYTLNSRGQWFAFIIAVIAIVGSIVLIYNDKDTLGGILGGTSLAIIIGLFISGKFIKNKEE